MEEILYILIYHVTSLIPCRDFSKNDIASRSWFTIILSVVISTLFLLFLFSIITIGYCYWKRKNKPQKLTCVENSDSGKEFDAFISYSSDDGEFGEDFMVPKLENGNNSIKCLLHIRDFEPGVSIMDQIVKAVEMSSCTIIILSQNYVESRWACHE